MSLVVTDFYNRIPNKGHHFTDEEAETLTVEAFDKLSLSDQLNLFESHRSVYDRLVNGNSADNTEATTDTRTDAERFCDEFEERLDRALHNVFHANEP